jgi:hypothetical protein
MLVAKLIRMEAEKREAEVERLYGEKGEISFGHRIRSYTLTALHAREGTCGRASRSETPMESWTANILKFMEAYLRHRKKLGGGAQDQDSRMSFYRFNDSARKALGINKQGGTEAQSRLRGDRAHTSGLNPGGERRSYLQKPGVEIDVIRTEIEKSVESRAVRSLYYADSFYPQAKFALEQAMCESIELEHDYIGTEHLLLGLLREGECILSITLAALGVELARVRAEVLRFLLAKHDKHTQF